MPRVVVSWDDRRDGGKRRELEFCREQWEGTSEPCSLTGRRMCCVLGCTCPVVVCPGVRTERVRRLCLLFFTQTVGQYCVFILAGNSSRARLPCVDFSRGPRCMCRVR